MHTAWTNVPILSNPTRMIFQTVPSDVFIVSRKGIVVLRDPSFDARLEKFCLIVASELHIRATEVVRCLFSGSSSMDNLR